MDGKVDHNRVDSPGYMGRAEEMRAEASTVEGRCLGSTTMKMPSVQVLVGTAGPQRTRQGIALDAPS
jgi:hypothetical protein